ncbi:MAG: thioredoxin fold domain-containing protein [Bacteroidales bacterium]
MKKFLTISTIVLLQFSVFATDTTIVFRKVNYTQVFELAKKENKAIMLYFHTKGCGACKRMEDSVFIKHNVANYYNNNFVCLNVNLSKDEGIVTNKKYNIKSYPAFIIINENDTILNKVIGMLSPEAFIKFGQDALSPLRNLTYLKQQYENKKTDADFMYAYCYALSKMKELTKKPCSEYLATQSDSNLMLEKNIRFIYEFAMNEYKILIPFDSRVYNFMLNNKEVFYRYFEKDQVDTRLVWIANDAVNKANLRNDEILFEKIIIVLKKFDFYKELVFKEMNGSPTGVMTNPDNALSLQIKHYRKNGNKEKYDEALKEFLQKHQDNSEGLNEIAWDYYENENDSANLQKAVQWVRKSIALNSNYGNNDTYACLLYKLGDYDHATEQAKKAIKLAKKKKMNYTETSTLLIKIKDKQKKINAL